MKIKSTIVFGILFFIFGFNLGYSINGDIPITEIPSIWPIRGGLGTVTMFFGENAHPITGQTFFHNGIDISTYRSGDAIIATADGKVIIAEYDVEYGNLIKIEHNHGFHTLYAHMEVLRIQVGQRVQQGEIIGNIGNTGISTGPHLHYEIHLFSEVVNPLLYINNLTNRM
jgi:murein DD-endopeptidase MepM/ murein hydrolase activator NlpD